MLSLPVHDIILVTTNACYFRPMIQKPVYNRLMMKKNLCLTMQGNISFDFPDWNVHSRQGDSVTLIVDVEC